MNRSHLCITSNLKLGGKAQLLIRLASNDCYEIVEMWKRGTKNNNIMLTINNECRGEESEYFKYLALHKQEHSEHNYKCFVIWMSFTDPVTRQRLLGANNKNKERL